MLCDFVKKQQYMLCKVPIEPTNLPGTETKFAAGTSCLASEWTDGRLIDIMTIMYYNKVC